MRTSTELSGPFWLRLSPEGNPSVPISEGWMPAKVPGCVHTDLLANGKIEDPFFGTNEKDQQWIGEHGWEYKTSFGADPELLSRERVELLWKGIDTYAEVFLNGTKILWADNMFRQWRVEVKSLLRSGDNELLLRFHSPLAEVKEAYERLGYVLPASNDQATPMLSMFTRKAPYHYGWDWGPRFVTAGIWRPASIEAWDDARIDDVQVLQVSLTDEQAILDVKTTVVAAHPGRGRVDVTVEDSSARGEAEIVLSPGANVATVRITLPHPQRWWPNGLGKQNLYTIESRLSVGRADADVRTTRIGLRTLEVDQHADKGGKSFTIRVNGAPVFMKGANYIPPDSFVTRVTEDRYRWLLQSAAVAHMNMLRVWGGGIYEDDRFYALCDELGILVWQDFMFACSMYPSDEAFVENVRREAIDNVRRLRNHPSLALWAGNNEIEAAWKGWGWQLKFALSETAQRTIWSGYQRLFRDLLPEIVAEQDPGRFYTQSSPSANDDAIRPNTLGFGDMHYWGVWHGSDPYEKYQDNVSRFMSEYGFQSFPEPSTVARYAPRDQFRIDAPVMLAHQRHPRGNQLIRTYMDRDFRTPKDFESFLYVSQVLQATIVQYAAEAHRRRMPYNAGSLYWQLDDCWPVASWSGIDYFGKWKALQYFARRFFAPLLVSNSEEGGQLAVYLVSDRRADAAVHMVLRLEDFEGHELWRKESDERVLANASAKHFALPLGELLRGADATRVVLAAEVFEGGQPVSRSLHYFAKTKELDLDDPGLTLEVIPPLDANPMRVRVTARRLARAVHLTALGAEGQFSDDFFDLLAGESVTVDWKGPPFAKAKATSIRDSYP